MSEAERQQILDTLERHSLNDGDLILFRLESSIGSEQINDLAEKLATALRETGRPRCIAILLPEEASLEVVPAAELCRIGLARIPTE